ncbi:MAG: MATE family efflux transporter [Synergistaceae bacterium]|nr:MATE family efflux transporter [Synergistaceae bacterium]
MNIFKRAASAIMGGRLTVDLGEGPVLSSLLRLSIPSIAMVLFHTLFNLVDTIFISWLGESYMVAISYTFPVQIGVWAIVEGVGNGVTALVGRRLGEGEKELAQRTATAGLAFSYLLCLLWIPFLFPGPSNAFFRMLGATDPVTLRQAWLYNMWIPPMMVFISFSYVVNSIFRCQGNTVVPLCFFTIANGLNLLLDPIFIFVFGWGMSGAAAATFVGRFVGTFYLIKKMRESSEIKLSFFTAPRRAMIKIWRSITAVGLPVTLTTGSVALGMGSVNKILASTYGNVAVAGWMVGIRIEDLAFNTLMGINDALVPFLAFNYGRRSLERMRSGIRAALIISGAITVTAGLLVACFPRPIISLFRPSEDIAAVAIQSIRLTIAGYPMVIYSVIYNALFIATGNSSYGLVIQVCRSMLLRIPAVWLLAGFVSVNWVWLFQPASFTGAAALTWLFSLILFRKLKKEMATAD